MDYYTQVHFATHKRKEKETDPRTGVRYPQKSLAALVFFFFFFNGSQIVIDHTSLIDRIRNSLEG